MHYLKMTDKNYGVWKMQDWKMTDNILDIVSVLQDIRITVATDGSHSRQLQQLVAYVKRQ